MNKIKKFKDKDRPKGKCYDCGMSYNDFPDMIIPNDMWELINPAYHKGAGLLCPTCMSKRLDQLNLWYKLEVNKKGDDENDKKELLNTLNYMLSLCESIKYEEFNSILKAKDKEELRKAEKKNEYIGIAKYNTEQEGISTISIMATIIDILTKKKLVVIVENGYIKKFALRDYSQNKKNINYDII